MSHSDKPTDPGSVLMDRQVLNRLFGVLESLDAKLGTVVELLSSQPRPSPSPQEHENEASFRKSQFYVAPVPQFRGLKKDDDAPEMQTATKSETTAEGEAPTMEIDDGSEPVGLITLFKHADGVLVKDLVGCSPWDLLSLRATCLDFDEHIEDESLFEFVCHAWLRGSWANPCTWMHFRAKSGLAAGLVLPDAPVHVVMRLRSPLWALGANEQEVEHKLHNKALSVDWEEYDASKGQDCEWLAQDFSDTWEPSVTFVTPQHFWTQTTDRHLLRWDPVTGNRDGRLPGSPQGNRTAAHGSCLVYQKFSEKYGEDNKYEWVVHDMSTDHEVAMLCGKKPWTGRPLWSLNGEHVLLPRAGGAKATVVFSPFDAAHESHVLKGCELLLGVAPSNEAVGYSKWVQKRVDHVENPDVKCGSLSIWDIATGDLKRHLSKVPEQLLTSRYMHGTIKYRQAKSYLQAFVFGDSIVMHSPKEHGFVSLSLADGSMLREWGGEPKLSPFVGAEVTLVGLKTKSFLNGAPGVVSAALPKVGRWEIRMGNGKKLKVREANLELSAAARRRRVLSFKVVPRRMVDVFGPIGVSMNRRMVAVWDLERGRLLHTIKSKRFSPTGNGYILDARITMRGFCILEGCTEYDDHDNFNKAWLRVLPF